MNHAEIRTYKFSDNDPASICDYIAKCSYAVSNNKSYDGAFERTVRLLSQLDKYSNLNLNIGEAIAEHYCKLV